MQKSLNQQQAAQMIGVTTHTIRRWVKIGKLRCTKIGAKKLYFNPEDLQELCQVVNENPSKFN